MGHNPSNRKLQALRAKRAEEERCLAGWRWTGVKLEPLSTVEGVLARGAVVEGRCRSDECRRFLRMDLQWWSRHGFGEVSINSAQQAYRCSRLGCALTWQQESYPEGVPLQSYVGGEIRIAIRCRKCGQGGVFNPERIITALEAAGVGNGNTGILRLGSLMHGQCRRCGYPAGWISEIVRPPVSPGGMPLDHRIESPQP